MPASDFNHSELPGRRSHGHPHREKKSSSTSAAGKSDSRDQPSQDEFKPAKLSPAKRSVRRRGGEPNSSSSKSDPSDLSSSVIFNEDTSLFDELDEIDPHKHEGGDLVQPPERSVTNQSGLSFNPREATGLNKSGTTTKSDPHQYSSLSKSMTSTMNRQFAASLIQSLQNQNTTHLHQIVPPSHVPLPSTDNRDSFVSAMTAGNATVIPSRESIVGGKAISEMTFEQQKELLAPERRNSSLLIRDNDSDDGVSDFMNNKMDHLSISEGKNPDNQRRPSDGDFTAHSGLSHHTHHTLCSYQPTKPDKRYAEPNVDVVVSSVDWSSLTKSCRRAKNAFRDEDSGLVVVKNMFLTHLNALTTVLSHYSKRYCRHSKDEIFKMRGNSHAAYAKSLEVISTRTAETKRALRFGMASLTPPRNQEEVSSKSSLLDNPMNSAPHSRRASVPTRGTDFRDDVERYRFARRSRQELQEAAVEGTLPTTANGAEESLPRDEEHRYGLQLPLVEIILGLRPWTEKKDEEDSRNSQFWDSVPDISDEDLRMELLTIQKDQEMIPVLAARLLCNLVTDNPIAAEVISMDVPFGPSHEVVEKRMSLPVMRGKSLTREDLNEMLDNQEDGPICWSDLITSTAKLQTKMEGENPNDHYQDREALSAVAAALHNLLASLETRDSLFELENEVKRREKLKDLRMRRRSTAMLSEADSEHEQDTKPADAGVDAASNRPLMNSLLRNILPAKGVITQSQQAQSSSEPEGTSDSATEWISLVLERMASRGLLPLMFQAAGGSNQSTVTPEKVVLVSCIRQAVDDYHSARAASGDCGEFGRRRLSIAAKSAGMTVLTRPHPLWGRVDEDFGGGGVGVGVGSARGMSSNNRRGPSHSTEAIRILLFIANEVDALRTQFQSLQAGYSQAQGAEVAEFYEGELSCTKHVIDDFRDILSQSLGRHASYSSNNHHAQRHKQCILAEARLFLGRDTGVIQSCCMDLAQIVDSALAKNHGRNARELKMTPQEQQSAVIMVRLIGNIVYRCRQNQDLLRMTQIPMMDDANRVTAAPSATTRTGLHVLLSATSLATACFTLREWCIVAIRNAVEDNDANAEAVRMLEANQALSDTPELRKLGVKIDLDSKGKVHVQRRDSTT